VMLEVLFWSLFSTMLLTVGRICVR
jgi:hypothetical protein